MSRSSEPVMVVLAGGNGAGKSTFYRRFIAPKGIPFVNADELAKRHYPDDPEAHGYDAMMLAEAEREQYLANRTSFCFETVFSHSSKVDFIRRAVNLGFRVDLYFIHLDNPELNVLRVQQRVQAGGHSVDEQKIKDRVSRSFDNVIKAIPYTRKTALIDNGDLSDSHNYFLTQAIIGNTASSQKERFKVLPNCQGWALVVLGEVGY